MRYDIRRKFKDLDSDFDFTLENSNILDLAANWKLGIQIHILEKVEI